MRILGIDPGTATTGYGAIETNGDGKYRIIKFGWISTDKKLERNLRLKSIYQQMKRLLKETNPDIVSLESLFFFNNAKTAMAVSEAIGVLRLAAVEKKVTIVEYPPPKIKSVVAHNGRAKKPEMKKAIRKILGVRSPNKKKTHFDDVADALAVAICHDRICQEGGEEEKKNG